jgi:hypothetical protein
MSDEHEGRGWVVEPPPGAGEISLFVALGEGAELDDRQQEALGQLLQALEGADAEVVGLGGRGADCPPVTTGCTLTCGTVLCKDLICWHLNKAAAAAPAGASWTISGMFGSIQ